MKEADLALLTSFGSRIKSHNYGVKKRKIILAFSNSLSIDRLDFLLLWGTKRKNVIAYFIAPRSGFHSSRSLLVRLRQYPFFPRSAFFISSPPSKQTEHLSLFRNILCSYRSSVLSIREFDEEERKSSFHLSSRTRNPLFCTSLSSLICGLDLWGDETCPCRASIILENMNSPLLLRLNEYEYEKEFDVFLSHAICFAPSKKGPGSYVRSPQSYVRRAKERSRVRSPQSAGFIRRTIHMEVVRRIYP